MVIDSSGVVNPDSVQVTVSIVQQVKCYHGYTGVLTANPQGGTGVYEYVWDDPGNQDVQTVSGLAAGTYHVTVTDENGCFNTASEMLTDPLPLSFAQIDSMHVSCKGIADGSIGVTVQGGTPPYSYAWSHIPVDTNFVEGLSAAFGGNYSVEVTDSYNCPDLFFGMQIKEPDVALGIMEISNSHVDNLCFGQSDGIFVVRAEYGWGGLEYSIDGVNWGPIDTIYTGLSANDYYPKVRDAGNCLDSVLVSIAEPSEITIQSQVVIGNTINVVATGGTVPLSYSLDGDPGQTTGLFNDVPPGDHTVYVTDANDCGPVETDILTIITGIRDYGIYLARIYPVPTSGLVTLEIQLNTNKAVKAEIYDIRGSLVLKEMIDPVPDGIITHTIDMGVYPKGIYILRLNDHEVNQRIVVK